MTINYLDAKRIQGLSTDVTDTPTFEDDFSTVKGWIPTGGNFAVNTTTGVMDFNRTNTTTNHSISYDLGAVVSDTWVLRYKVTFTTLGNVASNWIGAGLSDLPSSSAGSASRDFVGTLMAYQNNANAQLFYTTDLNNQSINGGYVDGSSGTSTLFVGTHYVQIVKTSATTYTVTIYSDSNYSIIRGVAQSGTTGATGLRYIVFIPENTGAGGTMVGTIDDIKFYNGVTSLTSKPTIAIPLTGCKAYYKFEETSGNLINQATTANGFTDGLGSSADGTNNGATQTATGKIGNAWYTTSTSNYVSIPNTLINGQNKISISTWFYPTVNGVNDIIFSGIFNYPSLLDWNLRFTQGHSTATIYIPTGTGNAGLNYHDYSGLGLSLNTWHHIAVVYDGT